MVDKNESRNRFEIEVDGHVAHIRYKQDGDRLELIHTEVPDELEGRGVGSRMVNETLAYARENGLKVIPTCPFVRSYLERHPDEQDVLAQPL